jgi:hypothetical protein
MEFKPVDRLPRVEWATWWDKTIQRWLGEGLPADLKDPLDIRTWFGLDPYRQIPLRAHRRTVPPPPGEGMGRVETEEEYEKLLEHYYPPLDELYDAESLKRWAEQQAAGEVVLWLTFEGFFWFPRTLFGIERHMTAFYETPELMHRMNADLLAYQKRMFTEILAYFKPDFMTFAEDMSYNNGPMISKSLFDEFMGPYYREFVPMLREAGTRPIVDSDGEISGILGWFKEVGVDGFLPLERRAGCDIEGMREAHPDARFIGAFDKTVMHLGEDAMRAEFERLLPVMRQGGYIPSCDHQTPPSVSIEDYRLYVRLLQEYTQKAAA